jgi:hypothetical protein
MALLGLTKATKGDEDTFDVYEGYRLVDPAPTLSLDPTGRMTRLTLRQKVSELRSAPPKPQSDDPSRPNYAPPLWVPRNSDVDGIV